MKRNLLFSVLLISAAMVSAQTEYSGEICEEAIPMSVATPVSIHGGTTYFELFIEDFIENHEDEQIKFHFVNETSQAVTVTASVFSNCIAVRPIFGPETRTIAANSVWNPSRGVEYNTVWNYWSWGMTSMILEIVSSGSASATSEYYDPANPPGPSTALHSITVSQGFGGTLEDVLAQNGISAYNIQLLDIMGRLVAADPLTTVSTLRSGIYILRADRNTIKLQVR